MLNSKGMIAVVGFLNSACAFLIGYSASEVIFHEDYRFLIAVLGATFAFCIGHDLLKDMINERNKNDT